MRIKGRSKRRIAAPLLPVLFAACISLSASAQGGSVLTAPANGTTASPQGIQFAWTSVAGAINYTLWVGTTAGAKDALYYTTAHSANPAGVFSTTASLQPGITYYATLWTLTASRYVTTTSTFHTSATALVASPANNAVNVDPSSPVTVSWTPVPVATSYQLILGSSAGANNYFDSGTTAASSLQVSLLPNTTYHARLFTNLSGAQTYSDSAFSTGNAKASLTYPLNGATGVSQFLPFTWTQAPGAASYVLIVSPTSYGAADFYWSAGSGLSPAVTSQYVYALQPLTTYYVELCTNYPPPALRNCVKSSFTTGTALPPPSNQAQFYQSIVSLAAQVNQMSQGLSHIPVTGSPLYNEVLSYGGNPAQAAKCGDFAITLLNAFTQNNILARQRSMSLDGPDGHVVTEFWDPFNRQWVVADPFFGVVYLNLTALTGQSAEQIQQLLLSGQLTKIDLLFVSSNGSLFMTNYYFNPLTAFANVVPFGTIASQAILNYVPNSPAQFLNEVDMQGVGVAGVYFFSFAGSGDSLTVANGGVPVSISPKNTEGWAPGVSLKTGWSISSASPAGMHIYTPISLPVPAVMTSTLTAPVSNATVSPQNIGFVWTSVANAINYTLWVGTTPQASDAFYYSTANTSNPTGITGTNATLKPGMTYYATLWTLFSGGYAHSASTFQTSATSYLAAPANGATVSPQNIQFNWTAVPGAASYTLWIGTTAGAKDALCFSTAGASNPAAITSTTASLNPGVTYYATLGVQTASGYTSTSSTFQTRQTAYLTSPANGVAAVSQFQPFAWIPAPGAQVYELMVSPTGFNVRDNFDFEFAGNMSTGYVWDLQPNTKYYVTLYTQTASGGSTSYSTFTTGASSLPANRAAFYNQIKALTAQVRSEASMPGNLPVPGSFLYLNMLSHYTNPAKGASCGNFAPALEDLLTQNQILSRQRYTTLDGADVHVITEYWDPFNSKWQVADATFGVMYLDTNSWTGQGVEDLNALLLAGQLPAITPLWVTGAGTYYMTTYYMDPITYYNNPFPYGELQEFQQVFDNVPNSPLPYLQPFTLGLPASAEQAYAFWFAHPTDQVTINNAGSTITVSPVSSAGWAPSVGLYPGWSITSSLPAGMQIYTPVWPSGFPVANAAVLTYPLSGALVAPNNISFNWTQVPNALSYTLLIGTTPGAQDALSFSTTSTSNPAGTTSVTASLPAGVTYYTTLQTQTSSGTSSTASSFQTVQVSYLTAPSNGATVSPQAVCFRWNLVPGAINYTIWVGTTPGAQDALYYSTASTSNPTGISSTTGSFKPSTTYYVTLWTLTSGGYLTTTSSFQTSATAAFLSPANGAVNLDPAVAITISWTPVAAASSYELTLGSSVGASDVYDSGVTTATSTAVCLKPNTTYYARLWTNASGVLTHADSVFSTGYALAHLTYPLNGAAGVSQFQPFTWSPAQGAKAYGVTVSPTGFGVADFFVGIAVVTPPNTSEYVWGLQPNTTYYAQLCTQNPGPGGGGCVNTTFTTGPALPTPSNRNAFYQTVQTLTAQVREMTVGTTNYPAAGTYLYQLIASHGGDPTQSTTCGWFAAALLDQFAMNDILARQRNLTINGSVGHVITEYWDPYNQKWQIADPTFGLVYFNPTTEAGQGAEDVSALLLARNYAQIQTLFLTPYGESYMTTYYADPITLYNNVDPFGMLNSQQILDYVPNSPLPYLNSVTTSVAGSAGVYEFQFASSSDDLLLESDSSEISMTPQNTEGWSSAQYLDTGWSILSAPAGMQIFTFNRVMF